MTRLLYNALQPSAARVTMDDAEATAVLAGKWPDTERSRYDGGEAVGANSIGNWQLAIGNEFRVELRSIEYRTRLRR